VGGWEGVQVGCTLARRLFLVDVDRKQDGK
jgi:hypothetical protein